MTLVKHYTKLFGVTAMLLTLGLILIARPSASFAIKPSLLAHNLPPQPNNDKTLLIAGIDVSHYQGKVDWAEVTEQKIHFAYLKATDGITYTDPMYHSNQTQINAHSLPNGAYHFFEPTDDGVKQAQNFLSQLIIHDNMLPPVLDVEINHGVDKQLIQQRVKQWLDTVEEKVGCKPIIYSYGSFYQTYLGEHFLDYPLWLADYAPQATLPKDVKNWLFWQHSQKGKVPGIKNSVDLNWYEGSAQSLSEQLCRKKA